MLWVDWYGLRHQQDLRPNCSIGISNVYPAEPPVENIEKIWEAINGRQLTNNYTTTATTQKTEIHHKRRDIEINLINEILRGW